MLGLRIALVTDVGLQWWVKEMDCFVAMLFAMAGIMKKGMCKFYYLANGRAF